MTTKTKAKMDYIAEPLHNIAVPLGDLTTHPRNAREGDIGAIMESLKRFGQQKPIVAQKREDEPHVIIAGNHLYRAATELGWTHIAVVVAPMDDITALSFLIADNRTQELGTYDDHALAVLLSELAMSGNLEATGYDGDDVDALLQLVGEVPSLDDLASQYSEDIEGETFWPEMKYRIEPLVYNRWQQMWGALPVKAATQRDAERDSERISIILDRLGA